MNSKAGPQNQQIDNLKNALWLAIMQSNCKFQLAKNEQIIQFFNSPKIEISVNTPLTCLGLTALHQACSNGNLNLVQFLVAIMKANIDQQDNYGRTPLHYACSIGNQAIVDYLIQSKAQPNIQTIGGDTPVIKAAQFHQTTLLLYLIETHSDKIKWNIVNKCGQNVLTIYRAMGVNSIEKQESIYNNVVDIKTQLLFELREQQQQQQQQQQS